MKFVNINWDIWAGRLAKEKSVQSGLSLYYCRPAKVVLADYKVFRSWLEDDEAVRADCYLKPTDRKIFIVAHALTRYALSLASLAAGVNIHPTDWRFTDNAYGKPVVVPPAGFSGPVPVFSLSHTRGGVAMAVAPEGELGVDIEGGGRPYDLLPLAERFLAKEEYQHIAEHIENGTDEQLFFSYWTLKESYLKAQGVGLGKELASFAFRVEGSDVRLLYDQEGGSEGWWFHQGKVPGQFTLALAFRSPGERRELRVYSGDSNNGWQPDLDWGQ
ncbi:MAG: 4'-phosphopantetheinyl transferase superfamily protein [Planctomycetota bacterium]|jgi:4'-phosphopantetheinyl transferase|nr:4'-phosphopantetheinyl transferase superfamily protein [Planctomycetota bacterium]